MDVRGLLPAKQQFPPADQLLWQGTVLTESKRRGSQRSLIFYHLGHEVELRAERGYLCTRGPLSRKHSHGRVFGVGEARPGTHAE